MDKMTHILETLNAMAPQWCMQFENVPELTAVFTVSDSGLLLLNGEPVCLACEVDVSGIFIDVESFGFLTTAGKECRFCVDWHFQGAPILLPWSDAAAV